MPSYLPCELVAHIATYLDRATLNAFRLANKDLSCASQRIFLERHFTVRTHLYTLRIMNRLLRICMVPRLVKCLERIEIVQPDNGLCNVIDQTQAYGRPGNMAWEEWILDAQALQEDDTTLLSILNNLKWHGVIPEFRVRCCAEPLEDQPCDVHKYIKAWASVTSVGEETMLYRDELCDLASYRLAVAIAESGFPLTSLILQDICNPALSFWYTAYGAPHLPRVFFTALSSMTNLRWLSLLFSNDPSDGYDGAPLVDIVEALKDSPLFGIEIRHLSGSSEDFLALLTQHASTLRQVSFDDIGVWSRQCWDSLLTQMMSMADLQRVRLKHLRVTEELITVSELRDGCGAISWRFESETVKDSINDSLARLVKERVFADVLEERI